MCPGAGQIQGLWAGLHAEGSFFEGPFAVGVDEGQVACLERQRHGLCLSGPELDFLKGTEPSILGSEGGDHVSTEEHDDLFAGFRSGVGDIDREEQIVVCVKLSL